jgi:guanylate kinase
MKTPRYQSRIFVVSGPSGSGKTTMIDEMMKDSANASLFVRVVTATTRAPRPGEVDGVQYHFLSKDEFKKREAEGWFIETKEYSGNWYGTPKMYVERAKAEGKSVLFCIEVDGAMRIKEVYPRETVLVFVYPPSQEELRRRLGGRGTDSEEVIARRMAIAQEELRFADRYDHGIVNDELGIAVDELVAVITAGRTATAK